MPFFNRIRKENETPADMWYFPYHAPPSTASGRPGSTGDMRLFPIQFPAGATVTKMGLMKMNATQNSTTWRLGIYNNVRDQCKPGTLLSEFGQVDLRVSASGMISVSGSATLLRNTLYWVAAKVDSLTGTSTGTMTTWWGGTAVMGYVGPLGIDIAGSATSPNAPSCLTTTGHGTGALPSDLSGTSCTQDEGAPPAGTHLPALSFALDGEFALAHWAWSSEEAEDSWQVI
jgi:hypothetical protein